MKNRLFFIASLTLLLGNGTLTNAQSISDGLYIGHRGFIVPKYFILDVQGDSISFEMFVRWQGSWLPGIGTWVDGYHPQHLSRLEEQTASNENIIVKYHRRNKLKGTVIQSIAGKVKFKLVKKDELPRRFKQVKSKAVSFTRQP